MARVDQRRIVLQRLGRLRPVAVLDGLQKGVAAAELRVRRSTGAERGGDQQEEGSEAKLRASKHDWATPGDDRRTARRERLIFVA